MGSTTWTATHQADSVTATAACPICREQGPTESLHVAPFPGGPSWPPDSKLITLEPSDHGADKILSSQEQMAIPGMN